MKKILLVLLCFPLLTLAQKTYVPDDLFETFLEYNGLGDGNFTNDSVPTSAIDTVTFLDIHSLGIYDLTGIEAFTVLDTLNCSDNQLATLDLSSNTALLYLSCEMNHLTALDLSSNIALTSLFCADNSLTDIDVSNNDSLIFFDCGWNQLTSLDVSNCSQLYYLYCGENMITSLDLSNNTSLEDIGCDNNDLISLDLRNGNNYNMVIHTISNPNLFCIDVDDVAWSDTNWTVANSSIDSTVIFNTNCDVALGCMDTAAANYDSLAIIDDGSCILCALTASTNVLDESAAGASDGSVELIITGSGCVSDVQIGTGTVSDYLHKLFYTFYHDSKVRMIYEAAELSALGINQGDVMDELGWNILSQDGSAATTPMAGANLTVNGVNVWSGTYQAVLGMNSFVFSTPVAYTGGDLVVEWCFDNTAYTSGNNYFECTDVAANLCIAEYADFAAGCTMTNLMSQGTTRPNLYLSTTSGAAYVFDWSNGDTTGFISNVTSGAYTVTATDCNGCTVTASATVGIMVFGCTDPLACNYDALATVDDASCSYPTVWQQAFVICTGDSVVVGASVYTNSGAYTDTLLTSGGCDSVVYTNISLSAPITWQQTFSLCDGESVVVGSNTYNATGDYIDTLTASNGCDSIVSTNVTVGTQLNINISTSAYTSYNVSCFGCNDGWISITVSGGIPPYSYSWDNGATSDSIYDLYAGSYSVTVTDGAGCPVSSSAVLTEPAPTSVEENVKAKNLLRVTDVLGREINDVKRRTLLYIYDDGTVEKRITID